ncbi:helix-turn-helix transcriptional regulator [Paenibacillus mesophilus]|uniref:helix-turn-helix transcriptional regulator n=1 Tax=Paenibacillus mesophilus TaxID=2582849 RepID=UPI0013053D0A|nr:AraC family transcriptional regulator [Paenibacillus mesophilus]
MKRIGLTGMNRKPFFYRLRKIAETQQAYDETFHAHQGMELQYIHAGEGQLILDQRTYRIEPNMLCLFQPFQLHRLRMDIRPHSPYKRSFVVFEPAVYEPYLQSLPNLQAFFRTLCQDHLPKPVIYRLPEEHEIIRTITGLDDHMRPEDPDELRQEKVAHFLITLIRQLLPVLSDIRNKTDSMPRPAHRVEQIMQWIERSYMKQFRLEALAQELHLSPCHVSHLFKETTGTSLSEYVKARRLRQACVLLTMSELSVAEIGDSIGLENTSYFCKIFKENKGITPHQYRLQWQRPK